MKRAFWARGGLLIAGLLMVAGTAQATTYSFYKLTNNGPDDLTGQLSLEVTQTGSTVDFTFTNNVGIDSSITDIYFEWADSIWSSALAISGESAGVDFDAGASPGNLPGGNTAVPAFVADTGFDSEAPVSGNGINSSTEWLTISGTLLGGIIIDNLFNDGSFRVGMHVQSIGETGNSDGYITTPSPVPLPAAFWLFGSALAGLGVIRKKVKKAAV